MQHGKASGGSQAPPRLLTGEAAIRILNNLPEAVSVCDESGRILYTNRAERDLSGYGDGELLGQPITVHTDRANDRLLAEVSEHLGREGHWSGIWPSRRKDGSTLVTRVRITAAECDGSPCWICVRQDITGDYEEPYRSLVEQASDGLFIADRDGTYTYVNAAACRMLGYTRDELLGMSAADVLAPADMPRLQEARRRLLETGETQLCEWNLRKKDGSFIPVESSSNLLPEGRWQGLVRDISERKKAEQTLRDTNKTLELLIQASPLPIVTFSLEGLIMLWNPAAEKLFGWTAAEVLGKPIPFIPSDKLDEHRGMRASDLSGRTFTGRVIRRLRKDGSFVDLSVSTAALRDEAGEITGIMSLYADVTEQKRSQAALLESEQRFRNMADTAPVLMWISDPDKRFSWFNKPWLDYRSRTLEQECGDGWTEGVHPEDVPRCRERYTVCFDARQSFQIEFRLWRATGEYHWILCSGVPRHSPLGEFLGYIGSGIDIHDRKQIEQDREAALLALARSNDELKQFASVASHDLQEPLRTISAYTQLIAKRYQHLLDSDGAEYMQFITGSAQRMSDLIQGLLAFSRVGDPRPLASEPASSADAVEAAVANLAEAIAAGNASIQVGDLPQVRAGVVHLVQVFQNLISNAIRYRQGNSVAIEISASLNGAMWTFCVRDNGLGIAPEHHQRIFGLFKRLHGPNVPGTGLGLAICKKIIEGNGGRIWVESQIGQGARFYFTLPG